MIDIYKTSFPSKPDSHPASVGFVEQLSADFNRCGKRSTKMKNPAPFPQPDQSGGYLHPKSAEPDSHPASAGFGEKISADFNRCGKVREQNEKSGTTSATGSIRRLPASEIG